MVGLRVLLAVVATVLAASAMGVATASAGGNSANAKLCQKDGWQAAQNDNGGTFNSNDSCTSYAAEGGAVFAPALAVTPSGCLTVIFGDIVNGPFAQEHFDATGFHPSSSISFFLPGETFPLPVQVTTDANGSASLPGFVLYDPGPEAMTAVDADGVHATVSFTASC